MPRRRGISPSSKRPTLTESARWEKSRIDTKSERSLTANLLFSFMIHQPLEKSKAKRQNEVDFLCPRGYNEVEVKEGAS